MNPLLAAGDLPDFAAIDAPHVTPALDVLLADAESALERAVGPQVPPDWAALSLVLDVPIERLHRVWGHVVHLQSVADTPALRAAHAANLPRVTDFHTRLSSDRRLFAKYKAIEAGAGAAGLNTAQRQALAHALRDFRLGGAELEGAALDRFLAIRERQAALSKRFGDNVLDATDSFSLLVPPERLAGVSEAVIAAARAAARADGHDGHCKLTLQVPCYLPVMEYAHDRDLREQLHRAYHARASELGAPAYDNNAIVQELAQLRQEEARLLGLSTFAHLSLVPKMARTPEQVLDFVRDLARRARPHAERELAQLHEFAARELGIPTLQPWDRAYASERLKERLHDFNSEALRAYFPVPRVLEGLFDLVGRLFGVTLREEAIAAWHPSVRFFRVIKDGVLVAGFTLDLYARAGKQSGAWMDSLRQRWARPDGGLQLPLAHLICNFTPPVGDAPSLLTHEDVITLFHEFGHGLHHMLTRVDELAVAGISGVEWDASELPSQFMENFCWQWEVLQRLTAHAETGAPLPRELYERMSAARNFQNGLTLLRHCEYGLFDMRLHLEPEQSARFQALTEEVAAELSPLAPPPFQRYPHSFTHLFDGGYAAGYYSYAWAEVLSADAFAAFEEQGLFDAATGERFCRAVLESGGSRGALESFVAFRGREPRIDALLRHRGLAASDA
jgi:oligopeptidase A